MKTYYRHTPSTSEHAARRHGPSDRIRYGDAGSDSFALELFRRAISERCENAWGVIVAMYRPFVMAWLRQHPAADWLGADHEYWCNGAFVRFWSALGPDSWQRFPNLAAVLQYLKLCTHSVLVDAVRAQHTSRSVPLSCAPEAWSIQSRDLEDSLDSDSDARGLWNLVCRLLPDETERLIAYLSFVRELKPREIQALHPRHFATTADVYRVKRTMLDRLRRSPELHRARVSGSHARACDRIHPG